MEHVPHDWIVKALQEIAAERAVEIKPVPVYGIKKRDRMYSDQRYIAFPCPPPAPRDWRAVRDVDEDKRAQWLVSIHTTLLEYVGKQPALPWQLRQTGMRHFHVYTITEHVPELLPRSLSSTVQALLDAGPESDLFRGFSTRVDLTLDLAKGRVDGRNVRHVDFRGGR